jgi:predicted nucleic acid-binding protein
MILVDANLLIYAVNADLPHHAASRAWLEQQLGGSQTVGLPSDVLSGRRCSMGAKGFSPISHAAALDATGSRRSPGRPSGWKDCAR